MSFNKQYAVPAVDGLSTLPAKIINYWDVSISNAVDGGSGGSYAPLAELDVGGLGLGFTLPGSGASSGMDWPLFHNDGGASAVRNLDRLSAMVFGTQNSSGWSLIITSVPQATYVQGSASGTAFWLVQLQDLVDGAALSQVVVNFGIVGGHGALPAVFPVVNILTMKYDGTIAVVGSSFISAASVGAYQALTSVTVTPGAAPTIDKTNYRYFIRLLDENGLNALGGNRFYSAVARCAAPQMRC